MRFTKFILLTMLLTVSMILVAAPYILHNVVAIHIGTYGCLIAAIGTLVTEILKFIPIVRNKLWIKHMIPILFGILSTTLLWHYSDIKFTFRYSCLELFTYGILIGFASSGMYSIIRVIRKKH